MSNFQLAPPIPTVTITPYDWHSYGHALGQTALTSAVSVANRAWYLPIMIYQPVTVYSFFVVNGAVISGNIDLGIYDSAGRLVTSTGSTAQAGANDYQEIALGTPVVLGPGQYYLTFAADNVTAEFMRRSVGQPEATALGQLQESNNFPLGATATFASITSSFTPLVGIRTYDPS